MSIIKFSVLSYYPSYLTHECMNIGVLFYCESTGKRTFEHISRWNRIEAFDDAIDINMFKIIIQGIKNQTEESLDNYHNSFNIENYIKFYVNELRFSSITSVEHDDFESFVKLTKKIHLMLDFPHDKRASSDEELKYLKSIIKGSTNINYSTAPIVDDFGLNVSCSFIIGRTCIKKINITSKSLSKSLNSLKVWLFNEQLLQKHYKVLIVYSVDPNELKVDPRITSAIDMIKAYSASAISFDELINNPIEYIKTY